MPLMTLTLASMGNRVLKICTHFERLLLKNQKCDHFDIELYLAFFSICFQLWKFYEIALVNLATVSFTRNLEIHCFTRRRHRMTNIFVHHLYIICTDDNTLHKQLGCLFGIKKSNKTLDIIYISEIENNGSWEYWSKAKNVVQKVNLYKACYLFWCQSYGWSLTLCVCSFYTLSLVWIADWPPFRK